MKHKGRPVPFQRSLSWSAALRDLRDDRARPRAIREERLSGGLTAWRGLSGRRYVTAPKAREAGAEGCVVVALHRGPQGRAGIVAVAAFGSADDFPAFRRVARAAGATELRVHRLAETSAARAAAVADLLPAAALDAARLCGLPLAPAGRFDHAAIMTLATATARVRRTLTGETWAACLAVALRDAWQLARDARRAAAH